MPTVKALEKKRTGVVKERVRTAGVAAKPATTATEKKTRKTAADKLHHLVTEQRVLNGQIAKRKEFDKLAAETATPADRKRKALPPGKRTSKKGNIYYENRPTHADGSRRSRI